MLLVVRGKHCGFCTILDKAGLFKKLDDDLDLVRDVATVETPADPNLATILTIDTRLPSIVYMSVETWEEIQTSGKKWQPLMHKLRFFNRIIDATGRPTIVPSTLPVDATPSDALSAGLAVYTYENVRNFCIEAKKDLEKPIVKLVSIDNQRLGMKYPTEDNDY